MSEPLILAIHQRHAEAILSGRKWYELRRRFPSVDPGTTVYLYVTAPVGAVVGGFKTGLIDTDSPSDLWSRSKEGLALSLAEFRAYVGKRSQVSAVRVERTFRLRRPATRKELEGVAGSFSSPQSAAYLKQEALQIHLGRLIEPTGV